MTRQQFSLWALCTLLLCGSVFPSSSYGQTLTIDRWHTVQNESLGEVQLRPVATLNENDEVTAWRVELRVPSQYGRTLQEGTPLDLFMEGGPDVAPSIEISGGEEKDLATVRASLSSEAVRTLAEASSARFVGGDVRIEVPTVFQADLKRMREKVSSANSSRPTSSGSDEVFVSVEEGPRLIGGMSRLQELAEYPASAKEEGVEGRVYIQFVVDERGRVVDPTVIRGVHPSLDSAAVRAVKQVGFEPGRQRGEPVKVQMSLPVSFRAQ